MLAPVLSVVLAMSVLFPAAEQLPAREREVSILVFRHHPGIIAGPEVMKARDADEVILLKAAREECGILDYMGGLGRGYELSLPAGKLRQWKTAVEKLMKAGTLRYSDHWGLDHQGYGLVPVR